MIPYALHKWQLFIQSLRLLWIDMFKRSQIVLIHEATLGIFENYIHQYVWSRSHHLTSVVLKPLLVFWKWLSYCLYCLPSRLSAVYLQCTPGFKHSGATNSQLFLLVLHFWHLWIHFPLFIIATSSLQILLLEGLHLKKMSEVDDSKARKW